MSSVVVTWFLTCAHGCLGLYFGEGVSQMYKAGT